MGLQYDFDIHWLIPQDVTADPSIAKMMGELGFNLNSRGNYMALFRDPRTAEALKGADDEVRSFFEESGFGWGTYDSGAGPGRFPRKDESAITDVTDRLSQNVGGFDLAGKNWNGFNMAEFLNHIVTMEPVDMAGAPPPQAPPTQGRGGGGGDTPLDRVRRKHEAASQAAAGGADPNSDGSVDYSLPDPDVRPMDNERRRRAVAADRQFRIKQGAVMIAGAMILFVVAISQGQKIITREAQAGLVANVPLSEAEVPTQDTQAEAETGSSVFDKVGGVIQSLSKATEADL